MSSLKEQNGRYYQEVEVVMLKIPTGASMPGQLAIQKTYTDDKLVIVKKLIEQKFIEYFLPQHLYFLSGDEIQEGDWYISLNADYIDYPKLYSKTSGKLYDNCKKIIATTDESLNYLEGSNNTKLWLIPKPSDSFIKKYIEEYNAGRQITKVLVEYCKIEYQKEFNSMGLTTDVQLKVDSDNTVTITKLKDSYSREEVEKLCIDALWSGFTRDSLSKSEARNWIKENL